MYLKAYYSIVYRPTGHLSRALPCKLYVNRPLSTGHRCPKPEIGRRRDPKTWRWFCVPGSPRHEARAQCACTMRRFGLLFELFSPVGDHRNWNRAGPFQGNIDQETLAVGCHVVEIPTLGNGPGLEEHLRLAGFNADRKSTRLNSSHRCISYAVFCLKK